jgi:chromosome segregation ATPase
MSAPRATNDRPLNNLEWLQHLCRVQNHQQDEILPVQNYWIIEPTISNQNVDNTREFAARVKAFTYLLMLYDISDAYYEAALAPFMKNWPVQVIGLERVSFVVISSLLDKLDLSTLKKIGIRNLDEPSLWLLYSKLLSWETNGNHNISVFFGEGISESWKQTFANIKDTQQNLTLLKNNSSSVLDGLIQATQKAFRLQTALNRFKAIAGKSLADTYEKLIKENQALLVRMAEKTAELATAQSNLTNQSRTSAQNLRTLNDYVLKLQTELNNSTEEIKRLNSRIHLLSLAEKEAEILNTRIIEMECELQNSQNEATQLNGNIKQLNDKILTLEIFSSDETADLRRELTQHSTKHSFQIKKLQKEISVLADELTQKNETINALTKQTIEQADKISKQAAKLQEMTTEVTHLRNTTARLTEEKSVLETSLQTSTAKIAEQKEYIDALVITEDQLTEANAVLTAQAAIDTQKIAARDSTIDTLTTQHSELEMKYSDLSIRHTDLKRRFVKLEQKLGRGQSSTSSESSESPEPQHHHKKAKTTSASSDTNGLHHEIAKLRKQLNKTAVQQKILVISEGKFEAGLRIKEQSGYLLEWERNKLLAETQRQAAKLKNLETLHQQALARQTAEIHKLLADNKALTRKLATAEAKTKQHESMEFTEDSTLPAPKSSYQHYLSPSFSSQISSSSFFPSPIIMPAAAPGLPTEEHKFSLEIK